MQPMLISPPVSTDWLTQEAPVAYPDAIGFMEEKVRKIRAEGANDLVWLLEHPPLYTAGTSAKPEDLLDAAFPAYPAGRGGQYTYHGPGQRVAYVMMDLKNRGGDLRRYICDLEEWIIRALAELGVTGERRTGRIGIWVAHGESEAKIAAVGVRVRKWVAYHGISVNVNPDLAHYGNIVPCGIRDYGVTSLEALGIKASMADVDAALKGAWEKVFA